MEVLLVTGKLDRSIELADETMRVFDFLTGHDEDNMNWLRSSAKPRIAKGFALVAIGQLDQAMTLADQSIGILETMTASDIIDHNVHEHLADAYRLAAWIHQKNDKLVVALEYNQKGIEHMHIIKQADRLNIERTGKLASIYVERGELYAAQGNAEEAQQSWQIAGSLLANEINDTQAHYLLDPWIRLLMFNDQMDDALKLSGALEARHYIPLNPWPN